MNAIVQGAVVHWRDYLDLCKPRVVALIMFTAIVGMFLAVPGTVPMQAFVFGTLGIGMAAGSAAAAMPVAPTVAAAVTCMKVRRSIPARCSLLSMTVPFVG